MSLIIFYPFAIHLKFDYASAGYTRPTAKNSDQTVMQQWCLNSDATVIQQSCLWFGPFFCDFDLGSSMSFSSFWDVIDYILSFCNALGVCLVTQDLLTKTVTEQWCNSDRTVMPSIWAFHYYLQGFEMSLIIFYPFAMPWDWVCDTSPFDKNSNLTVWGQWWNSDVTVMEQLCLRFELFYVMFKVLRCHWS
jgi:hypothetical protein